MPASDLPLLPLPWEGLRDTAHPHRHVIVPYAALLDASCQHQLGQLQLPHLEQLLRKLQPAGEDLGQEDDRIPPHERVAARAWGLDPQAPAWAAASYPAQGAESAWLTLCHWTTGADQVRMDDPAALDISPEEAQALHALLQPWFAEDGWQLQISSPGRWWIQGPELAGLQCASLDRVLLRDASHWLPEARSARKLHRLQSEVQMLLYEHPFNARRRARGQMPINAFWLHGNGALSPEQLAHVRARQSQTELIVVDALRQAALRQHWAAWKSAWEAADAGPLAQLLQHLQQGGSASLSLCGERHARTWDSTPRTWLASIRNTFQPQRFAVLHQAL